jgi:gephyrin
MPLDSRTEFHRVILRSTLETAPGQPNRTEMVLKASSTGGQRSSRVASLCEANGLVILPPLATADSQDGRKKRLEVGEYVEAMIIGEIEMI